MIELTYLK